MCARASARRGQKTALTSEVLVRNLKPGFFYPRCTRSQAAHTGHFETAWITSQPLPSASIYAQRACCCDPFSRFMPGVYAAKSDRVIIRSTARVRIWLILAHDLSGRFLAPSSNASGTPHFVAGSSAPRQHDASHVRTCGSGRQLNGTRIRYGAPRRDTGHSCSP